MPPAMIQELPLSPSQPEKFARYHDANVFASMDATNIDLKTFDQIFYHELCSGDLATVLETLSFVAHETDTWLEITILLAVVFRGAPGTWGAKRQPVRLADYSSGKDQR